MKGYIIKSFLLLICQVLIVSLSDVSIEENNNMGLKEKYLENRRNLPLFPKNNIKFVMTQRPYVEKAYTHSPRKQIIKMSLMDHVTQRYKIVSPPTKLVSRKPLMKPMIFTMNTRVNGKYNKIQNSTNAPKKAENSRSGIQRKDPVTQFTEDYIPDVYLPEESNIHIEKLQNSDKIDVDLLDNQNNKEEEIKSGKAMGSQTNADSNSYVEEQDHNEFIFIENNKNETANGLDDNIDQDFDMNVETTTEIKVMENNSRLKRSNNIIEEENVASTISGIKYTGKDRRLYHDVYFKNIHS